MFDEPSFLWALTVRPEDAKKYSQIFKPEWLETVEYRPMLAEIYAFTRKYGEPPSLDTLHKIFKDKDEEAYNNRYKPAICTLQEADPDRSDQIYTLEQAKNVAVIRSFIQMLRDESFIEKQAAFDGTQLIRDVQSWITQFEQNSEDRTMDLKHAIEHLVQSSGFDTPNKKIPCGIKCIDDWTGGGLRPKQFGILILPTGHGKSASLLIMGNWIAAVENKRVWYITNELPIEEVTERNLARITGIPLDKIIDDPAVAYKGLTRYWTNGLDQRIVITEFNREVDINDIEAEMAKMANLHGWKPDVIVLDFMERMKPALSGFSRDKEWNWIGGIAKDIARFCKKHSIMLWTAAQTNRSGLYTEDGGRMGNHMTQGSIKQLQEASAVIMGRQIPIPGLEDTDFVAIEFMSTKMRQSRLVHAPKIVKADLGRMSITDEEIEVVTSSTRGTSEDEEEDKPAFDSSGSGKAIQAESPRDRQKAKQRRRSAQQKFSS